MIPAFVAEGSSSRATNGATTPGLPAGLNTGDLLIMVDGVVSYAGTGGPNTPSTPAGWSQEISFADTAFDNLVRLTLMYHTYASGDSAPSVPYTGHAGGTNDNHYSRIYGFRNMGIGNDPTDQLGAGSACDQSSTACGPITGFTTGHPNSLVFLAAARDDQFASSTVASGDGLTWTKQTDFTDGTADAMSVLVDWAIAPQGTTVTSKTITVTTGNNARSAAVMWSVQALSPNVPLMLMDAASTRSYSW